MSAGFASQIVELSGLGQFNRIDLQKKLSGESRVSRREHRRHERRG